ncbi:hypothetical protein COLO4_16178 [Corchorus olitorius]|uniref:Uncharacterized protein n=1 Tax=Corchorus olitorius TaxID=93759 RepID=A0A1R3JIR6_9ROSI|nr:hypothetical protein COLO4_16178 [Corchorus olitorius]
MDDSNKEDNKTLKTQGDMDDSNKEDIKTLKTQGDKKEDIKTKPLIPIGDFVSMPPPPNPPIKKDDIETEGYKKEDIQTKPPIPTWDFIRMPPVLPSMDSYPVPSMDSYPRLCGDSFLLDNEEWFEMFHLLQ